MRTSRSGPRAWWAPLVLASLIVVLTAAPARAEWHREYDAGMGGWELGVDLTASGDGTRVFALARAFDQATGGTYYLTLALGAATGEPMWATLYGGDDYTIPTGIAASAAGTRVFATGWSGEVTATVAFDGGIGTQLWVREAASGYRANAIAVGPEGGRVYVGGAWTHDFRTDFTTIAYGARTGRGLWKRYLTGTGDRVYDDEALALTTSRDGRSVFATGRVVDAKDEGAQNVMTVAYRASDGRVRWAVRYNGEPTGGHGEAGVDIAVVGDVVAVVTQHGSSCGALLAYDARTGKLLWTRKLRIGTEECLRPIATAGGGSRIFVSGDWQRGDPTLDGSFRVRTLAFAPGTGRLLWRRDRAGSSASDLAIDPADGAVYMVGSHGLTAYATVDGTLLGEATPSAGGWVSAATSPATPDVYLIGQTTTGAVTGANLTIDDVAV